RVVEGRAADRREVAERGARAPVRERRPPRLVELPVRGGEARARREELRRVPLGEEQTLLEAVGVDLDRGGRRRRHRERAGGGGRLRRLVIVVEVERPRGAAGLRDGDGRGSDANRREPRENTRARHRRGRQYQTVAPMPIWTTGS